MITFAGGRKLKRVAVSGFFRRFHSPATGLEFKAEFESRRTPTDEADARVILAQGFRIAAMRGLQDIPWGGWGNMSLRIPDTDHFLCIDFPNVWSEASAARLVKVDLKGNIIADPTGRCPSAHPAWGIHGAIHGHRPDANCVMHTHTTAGVAFSSSTMKEFLPVNQEILAFYQRISHHEYSTKPYMEGEVPDLAISMGPTNRNMIMQNHGLLTIGETVGEAVFRMCLLNEACATQLQIMSSGAEPAALEHDTAEFIAESWETGFNFGQYEWESLVAQDNRARQSKDAHWDDVLDFWFASGDVTPNEQLWWGNPIGTNDDAIRQRFGSVLLQALSENGLSSWEKLGSRPATAAIIALDQFPRMAFRGTASAFAGDAAAKDMATRLLRNSDALAQMPLLHRFFVTLPLQHSEDMTDQLQAVAQVDELATLSKGSPLEGFFLEAVRYARDHQRVVSRFGRFPNRNEAMRRTSSAAEQAYLDDPDCSAHKWGQSRVSSSVT